MQTHLIFRYLDKSLPPSLSVFVETQSPSFISINSSTQKSPCEEGRKYRRENAEGKEGEETEAGDMTVV